MTICYTSPPSSNVHVTFVGMLWLGRRSGCRAIALHRTSVRVALPQTQWSLHKNLSHRPPSPTTSTTQAFRQLSGDAQRCSTADPPPPTRAGSLLRTYGRDLTQEAREGRLDPLVGRSDVLARTLQVLLRRTKNNPLLLGDPGVGRHLCLLVLHASTSVGEACR